MPGNGVVLVVPVGPAPEQRQHEKNGDASTPGGKQRATGPAQKRGPAGGIGRRSGVGHTLIIVQHVYVVKSSRLEEKGKDGREKILREKKGSGLLLFPFPFHLSPGSYAEGGSRTHTGLPLMVFETTASAIPPLRLATPYYTG